MSSYLYEKSRYGPATSSMYKPTTRSTYTSSTGSGSGSGYSKSSSLSSTSSYSSSRSSSTYSSNRYSTINTSRTSRINETDLSNKNSSMVEKKVLAQTPPAEDVPSKDNLDIQKSTEYIFSKVNEVKIPSEEEKVSMILAKSKLNQCNNGFMAMCILLQNYSEQVIPKLYSELNEVKEQLNLARKDNYDLFAEKDNLLKEIELEKLKHSIMLKKQNEDNELAVVNLEVLKQNFDEEIKKIRDTYEIKKRTMLNELEQKEKATNEQFENLLKEKQDESDRKLKQIKNEEKKKINDLNETHQKTIEQLNNLLEYKKNNPEMNLYKKEIESLHSVLEMKNAEIHELRVHSCSLEEDLKQLPLFITKLTVAEQKNAEIREALELKKIAERRLSQKHMDLIQLYEKEKLKSKHLSLDNDQLQYRLTNYPALQSDCNINGNESSLKRQWSDDLIDINGPLSSPSLIQIYMDNNNSLANPMTKEIPVTVYTNDGVHKVFVFDNINTEEINNSLQNGSTNTQNGANCKQKIYTIKNCENTETNVNENDEHFDEDVDVDICLEMTNNLSDSGVYSSFNLDITCD